jgi:membrane carboxypeptidase/penicillin-binding protein
VTPTLVDRIQDRYGRTIYRHDGRTCRGCNGVEFARQSAPSLPDDRAQVLDPENAFQVVSLLQGAAQRSPAVQPLGKRVAGKTGSTNESVDAWFVGFHSDLAVAVWIGFDKPRSLGKKETGSIAAAPIFAAFMKEAMTVVPARDFVPPKSIVAVQTAAGKEFYKRGTEPGTGMGRELDRVVAKKTDPDAEVDDRAGIDADMPELERRPPHEKGPPRSYYGYQPDPDEPRPDLLRPESRFERPQPEPRFERASPEPRFERPPTESPTLAPPAAAAPPRLAQPGIDTPAPAARAPSAIYR